MICAKSFQLAWERIAKNGLGKVITIKHPKKVLDRIKKLVWSINGLEERYEIITKSYDSYIKVHFREIKTPNKHTPLLCIILLVHLDRHEYLIECFEVNKGGEGNEELTRLHSNKVEGPWNLKELEIDLLKIVRREFSTFKRQYYPF